MFPQLLIILGLLVGVMAASITPSPSFHSNLSILLARAPLTVLVLPLALFFLFTLSVHRLLRFRLHSAPLIKLHGCKPPSSYATIKEPILGLDFILDTIRAAKQHRYLEFGWQRFQQYGPTFVTKRLLFETVHTIDPENIKTILATDFHKYTLPSLRINAMSPLFGSGIFASTGHHWAHSRALLRPSFTKHNMAPLLTMMERHFQLLLQQIPESTTPTATSPSFDLQSLMYSFTMDVGTSFLLGKSAHSLDPTRSTDADKAFVEDYTTCCVYAVKKIQLGPLSRFYYSPTALRARDRAWRYVERFVDEAVGAQGEKSIPTSSQNAADPEKAAPKSEFGEEGDGESESIEYNFLRELVSATSDRAAIRDEILNILLASRDTTAGLLSNLFFELSRQPELYAELRKEVMETIPDGVLPTEPQLKSMKFLRYCINESLRLHPVVPVNSREALISTTLPHGGGPDGKSPLFIPAGTLVLYNPYAMHRRDDSFGTENPVLNPQTSLSPSTYPCPPSSSSSSPSPSSNPQPSQQEVATPIKGSLDPQTFNPHRWPALRPGWSFLPFNGGPRICLGQQFAIVEASYVIARIVQTFSRLESRDDRPWTEFYTLAVCNRNGVNVAVEKA